jgi:hypothetical protein
MKLETFSAGALRAPLFALSLAVLLGQAPQAMSANFLTMTEHPDGILDVSLSLLGVTQNAALFDPTFADGQQDWGIGPGNNVLPALISATSADQSVQFNNIAWLDAGSSADDLADAHFNVFVLHGTTDGGMVMSALSGLSYNQLILFGNFEVDVCRVDDHGTPCPILSNGASLTTPLRYRDPTNQDLIQADPFTITFTDERGGTGVPEPASWALMLTGFFGLGALLRRRRTLAAQAI